MFYSSIFLYFGVQETEAQERATCPRPTVWSPIQFKVQVLHHYSPVHPKSNTSIRVFVSTDLFPWNCHCIFSVYSVSSMHPCTLMTMQNTRHTVNASKYALNEYVSPARQPHSNWGLYVSLISSARLQAPWGPGLYLIHCWATGVWLLLSLSFP